MESLDIQVFSSLRYQAPQFLQINNLILSVEQKSAF